MCPKMSPLRSNRTSEVTRETISIVDLNFAFRDGRNWTPVLEHLSLMIREGEFLALVGSSGCGKTTLLKTIAGLYMPSPQVAIEGQIFIDRLPPKEARSRGLVGFMFQSPVLLPWRTVRQNVQLVHELRDMPERERRAEVDRTLSLTKAESYAHKYAWQISGGMQQRVALAMALISAPRILLLDEPFGSLDYHSRIELGEVLLEVHASTQLTTVVVTHDLVEACTLASYRVVALTKRPARVGGVVTLPEAEEKSQRPFVGGGRHQIQDAIDELRSFFGGDGYA